jgi:hypothetical protein
MIEVEEYLGRKLIFTLEITDYKYPPPHTYSRLHWRLAKVHVGLSSSIRDR